jgi:hypothetical protein
MSVPTGTGNALGPISDQCVRWAEVGNRAPRTQRGSFALAYEPLPLFTALDVCRSPGDLWLNFPNALDLGALDRIANSV